MFLEAFKAISVKAIVDKAVEKPFMGIFGTEKVNVLKLNPCYQSKEQYNDSHSF